MLRDLDAGLDDEAAPRRLLLWADAGRGKSALLVRWLERLAPRRQVILLPISIGFGTNRPDLFYHALATALAAVLGEELAPPSGDAAATTKASRPIRCSGRTSYPGPSSS